MVETKGPYAIPQAAGGETGGGGLTTPKGQRQDQALFTSMGRGKGAVGLVQPREN